MFTKLFSNTIVAVPPFARTEDGEVCAQSNEAIMAHLAAGGVKTFLIGGNALVHLWPMSKYAQWWDMLVEVAPEDSILIPSVGPDEDKLLVLAEVFKTRTPPLAMLLPFGGEFNFAALDEAMRAFHRTCGVPLILYIKIDEYISAEAISALVEDGIVGGVKYAVPREVGAEDPYLDLLIAAIGAERILSGFGEPPAVAHLRDKNLLSFTSGCCCVAPALSMAMRAALKRGDNEQVRAILELFMPLEKLRGEIGEIRVLHEAISAADIAPTGPFLKPCDPVPKARSDEIRNAACDLLEAEKAFRAGGLFE